MLLVCDMTGELRRGVVLVAGGVVCGAEVCLGEFSTTWVVGLGDGSSQIGLFGGGSRQI